MYSLLTKTKKSLPKQTFLLSGGKRIRTADPLHAMQVLYQLSYTPSDEDQCNIPLKKMSRINLGLKHNFFIFALFTVWALLGSGCRQEKQMPLENTLRHDFQLENVIKTLDTPPLERESYTHTSQTYKVLDTFKSSDKTKNSHRHYYLSAANPLSIETLESLMREHGEGIHWIYASQQGSALASSNDKAFTHFAHCVNRGVSDANPSTQALFFKTAYTYKGPAFVCELSYIP